MTPSLVLPNCKQALEEPRKYLKIHWTAFQYSLSGFAMYLLIVYDKFRSEHTIAYVRDPTALEYGTHDIYIIWLWR